MDNGNKIKCLKKEGCGLFIIFNIVVIMDADLFSVESSNDRLKDHSLSQTFILGYIYGFGIIKKRTLPTTDSEQNLKLLYMPIGNIVLDDQI